jgi:UDP-GlcNAc:undecaprenyl-phosphate/decaprenyl-phosphate GlcNAc-1-phosphate transferase
MNSAAIIPAAVAIMSFACALAGVPLAKRLAFRCDATDVPGPGHPHNRPTAKLGGLAILSAFMLPLIVTESLPLWIGLCATAMLVLGIVDDLWILAPRKKLALQILIVGVFAFTARGLGPTLWPWLFAFVTVFWLITTTNAFNLIDGLDGLACGIGIVACGTLFVAASYQRDREDALLAMALGAALLGFLTYNFHPASIFMGDAGALPVGFLLGVLSLRVAGIAKNSAVTAYAFPLFLMLVPLLDVSTVTVTRLATGRPISQRGTDHSHHRLLGLGLSHRYTVIFFWAISLMSGFYAFGTTMMPHAYLVVTLPVAGIAFAPYTLFLMDLTFDRKSPGATYSSVPRLARMILSLGYWLRLADLLLDLSLAVTSYFLIFLLWTNFRITDEMIGHLLHGLPWVLVASCSAFFISGIYRGMWRYMGFADVVRYGYAATVAGVLVIVASAWGFVPLTLASGILFSILLFDLLFATRLAFQLIRKVILAVAIPDRRILVVGAARTGEAVARECETARTRTRLVGFVDDDVFKHGKRLGGIRVLGSLDAVSEIYASTPFDEIVIAVREISESRVAFLREFAHGKQLRIYRYSSELDDLAVVEGAERNGRNHGEAIRTRGGLAPHAL